MTQDKINQEAAQDQALLDQGTDHLEPMDITPNVETLAALATIYRN